MDGLITFIVVELSLCMGLTLMAAMVMFVRRLSSKKPRRLGVPQKEEKLVKIVYVVADMRSRGSIHAVEMLEQIQQQFVHLLRLGVYPVTVGVNTEYTMRDYALPIIFEEAGKELAGRCDALLLMPGFNQDPEADEVYKYAKTKVSKIFNHTDGNIHQKLKAWALE